MVLDWVTTIVDQRMSHSPGLLEHSTEGIDWVAVSCKRKRESDSGGGERKSRMSVSKPGKERQRKCDNGHQVSEWYG